MPFLNLTKKDWTFVLFWFPLLVVVVALCFYPGELWMPFAEDLPGWLTQYSIVTLLMMYSPVLPLVFGAGFLIIVVRKLLK